MNLYRVFSCFSSLVVIEFQSQLVGRKKTVILQMAPML